MDVGLLHPTVDVLRLKDDEYDRVAHRVSLVALIALEAGVAGRTW